MSKLVSEFKALSLAQQHETYPAITAAYNAAKDARRVELEAEIKLLGFRPGEAIKKPERPAKYRSPAGETWSGVGALATWLRKLKEAGEDIEKYRV